MNTRPKIIDCFAFFNELELLELRLKTLDSVVDRFVLVEARETFQGTSKTCFFEENAARFAAYSHKITHLVVDRFTETSLTWDREAEQRNHMNATVAECDAQDIILLSDVDELPRPECLQALRAHPPRANEIVCFSLQHYFYFLNLLYREPWQRLGPRAVLKRSFNGMENLRHIRGPVNPRSRDILRFFRACIKMRTLVSRRLVRDAGWHFSWLGGEEAASTKIMAISVHKGMKRSGQALRDDTLKARREAISNHQDFSIVPIDDSFPAEIRNNIEAWQSHILTDDILASEMGDASE